MPARQIPDSIVLAIVTTIAEQEGLDPLELEPLQHTLNVEALEKLFDGTPSHDLRIQFQYYGYEVTVTGDGQVTTERSM